MSRKSNLLLSLLLLITLFIGIMSLYIIYYHVVDVDIDQLGMMKSELLYVFLLLALILLFALLRTFRHLRKRRKFIKRKLRAFNRWKRKGFAFSRKKTLPGAPDQPLSDPKGGIIEPQKSEFEAQTIQNQGETENVGHRFFMLNEIDRKKEEWLNKTYPEEITLKRLSEDFRQYAAFHLGLYYDRKDIRRFIGGLAVTKLIILQGMSGTGKTSLAYAFGEYINNPTVIVPVQPMWKERTDLIGYYNEFTKKFNETVLLQKMYEAHYNPSMYLTLLDEINIARIEYYFAEFLSLLEIPDPKKRYLDVVSDQWETDPELLEEGQILLPNNMWFVGTANNDDSTFAISDKVYDRAMVLDLDRKAKPFMGKETAKQPITAEKFFILVQEAQRRYAITERNERRIRELDEYLIKHFQITFGNRIMNQIRNYVPVIVALGGTELEAIDDILARKVLRKLTSKNLAYVKSAAPGLLSYIDQLFGEDEMEQCREFIRNIEVNV
ncbi:MAG TPA: AAA family ATPase [Haloplasmataceae bacterium]